jgi:hypothetical protein
MPLKNSEFGDWEIIQDDPYIRAQHQKTGETVTLHEDGQMDAPAVSTDRAAIDNATVSATVQIDGGTIVATSMTEGELATGDINTQSDVRTTIQTAIDHVGNDLGGGRLHIKQGTYTMDAAGDDAEGTPYCLSMQDGVALTGEGDATLLEYPAVHDDTDPKIASPILCTNTTEVRFKDLKVDAGYHTQPQSSTDGAAYNAMAIKIGLKNVTRGSTKCVDTQVIDCTISGAYRHGVEATDASERTLITGSLFDDASGDDDVSISIDTRYSVVRDSWSINKDRDGGWTAASFEAEDGAEHVVFDSLFSIEPSVNGITVGKSHVNQPPCKNHVVRNCTVYKPALNGFNVTPSGDGQTSESISIDESNEVIEPGLRGVSLGGEGSHTIKDFEICPIIRKPVNDGVNLSHNGATYINLDMDDLVVEEAGNFGVAFRDDNNTSITWNSFTIRRAEISTTAKDAIFLGGVADNYAGFCEIRNCDLSPPSGWSDINVDGSGIRQYVQTLENRTVDDASDQRLVNAGHGTRMFADASIRSTSYDGYDYYDADNGTWREMA